MRRSIVACALALATALLLAACSKEEADVVDRALSTPVRSAQLALTADVAVAGVPPIRVSLDGPFRSNGPDRLPSFDWRLRLDGAGQAFAARALSDGRNVFVEYEGRTYEVGEEQVAALMREQARSGEAGEVEDLDDLERLGIDLKEWFPRSDTEEDSEVAGVATTRVTGRLDVEAAVRDLRELLRRPEFRAQLDAPIPDAAFEQIERAISDPKFVLEAGQDDGKLRALSASMRIRAQGAGATLRLGLTLRDVDRPVQIRVPQSGRPIEELLERFGLSERELEAAAAG